MSIGSKMRSLGESTYFLKAVYEPLKELMGNKEHEIAKDPIRGFILHTDRIDDELLENVDDLLNDEFRRNFRKSHYNHNMEISWCYINKYANCTTINDMSLVNSNFKNDLTSEGEWVYPLPKITNIHQGWYNHKGIKKWSVDLPNATNVGNLFKGSSLNYFTGNMPKVKGNGYTQFVESSLIRFKGNLDNLENGSQFFWYAHNMKEFDSSLPSLSQGVYMFMQTKLDKESTFRILNSIPAYTGGDHRLTIGIHIDHKNDDEILSAIASAEAKGWAMTVQWEGTPTTKTTSTFGLRKPSIYAKLSEIERPDGTKEQVLDWGHYVTNPEDYQEFSSLEEAYEHFGLPNDLEKIK